MPEASKSEREIWKIADLVLDVGQQRLWRDGTEIPLPKLSFDLLLALARRAPDVLSTDELMSRVWPGIVVSPETIVQRVRLLRVALGEDAARPQYVQALRNRGYRLLPPAVRAAGETAAPPGVVTSPTSPAPAPPVADPPSARRVALTAAVVSAGVAAAIGLAAVTLGPAAAWNRGRAAALVERRSAPAVAVLPFVSLSADPADEILARGLPEVTLDRLASVRGLTVIARDSAFAPLKAASAAEIGKMLDARYLVEGSVQRQGTAVRVTARLVEAPTETQLWSATFDRRTGDLFVVQDEIANGVAGALQNRVAGLVKPDPFVPPSRNPDAMLAYLRGRALVGRYTVVEAVAAAEQFERAIALDPRFASALAALYDARMQAASLRAEDLAAARDRNVDLVDRALQLDPRCGAAYFARATWADPKDPRRDDDFRRGVDLEPSHGRGLTAYAEYLYNVNRRDEAQRMLARALTVDPRSPRAYYRRAMQTLPVRGRDIEQEMLQVLQLDPAFYPALQRYAKFRWQHHGEIANAIAIVERAIASDPENPLGRYTAAAFYLDAGDAFAARDVASGTAASAEAARTLVALQARDSKGAAQAALDDSTRSVVPLERWGVVEALRDAALASPPGSPAERALLEKYAAPKNVQDVELLNHRALIFHAHVLQARGRRDEAEAVVRRVLAWAANHEQYGLFHGVRARAYALLGDRDRALQELEASFTLDGDYRQWWYTLDQERMFDAIRVDPRFGRIRDLVARHVAAERARLEELRAKADLPPRDGRRTQRGVVVASGSGAGR